MHGTTIHGAERILDPDEEQRPGEKPELAMYYYDGSAIAQAIDAARERAGGTLRFAVVGLGAGSLACRADEGDTLTYYEIDPAVVTIARDPELFTFLSTAGRTSPIVMGDARLTLADAPDARLRPHHRRCVLLRRDPDPPDDARGDGDLRQKLSPNGMVVMHISNRHLELASVVAGIAQRERPRHARQQRRRRRAGRRRIQDRRHGHGSRAATTRISPGWRHRNTGRWQRPIRSNGCGPTTIPTSSAR